MNVTQQIIGKMARQYQWILWELTQDDTAHGITYMNVGRTASIQLAYDGDSIAFVQVSLHSVKDGTTVIHTTPEEKSQRNARVLSWFVLYSTCYDTDLFYDAIPQRDLINGVASLLEGRSFDVNGVTTAIESVTVSAGGWLTVSFEDYGPVVVAFTSLMTS
jgi:hypothetical protein